MRGPRTARAWTQVALGGLCLATLFALAAPLGWPFELFSHFRPQYVAAAIVLTILLFLLRSPRGAVLAASLGVFQALPALQRTVADEPNVVCSGRDLTVVTANLQFSNLERERFLGWLAAHPADLVVVQEVTAAWAGDLSRIAAYPHQKLLVREDPYGIGVLSRWPLDGIEPRDFAGDGLPSLEGQVSIDGEPLQFLALHAHWPITPGLASMRDRSLDAVAAFVRANPGPVVALGDLNLTVYSPEFAWFLGQSGLRDAMRGALWQPTWMAGFWPLALRIDHVLVSPGICVHGTEVGPAIGSDHRPVIARLRLATRPAG